MSVQWLKKLDFNTKITEVENMIPDVSGLVTKTGLNAKPAEIPNKILNHNRFIITHSKTR